MLARFMLATIKGFGFEQNQQLTKKRGLKLLDNLQIYSKHGSIITSYHP
jgi:hypothetical protein